MGLVVEICKELYRALLAMCRQSVLTRIVVVGLVAIVAVNIGWTWALLGANARAGRFHVHDVEGSVAYVDGSVVPAEMMLVKMFPDAGGGVETNTSMPVTARVDPGTGRFHGKLASSKKGRNTPAETWRVVVLSGNQQPLSEEVVPREYGLVEKTPLIVAMDGSPLRIRIPRPSAAQ
jgi:hypothetical protein